MFSKFQRSLHIQPSLLGASFRYFKSSIPQDISKNNVINGIKNIIIQAEQAKMIVYTMHQNPLKLKFTTPPAWQMDHVSIRLREINQTCLHYMKLYLDHKRSVESTEFMLLSNRERQKKALKELSLGFRFFESILKESQSIHAQVTQSTKVITDIVQYKTLEDKFDRMLSSLHNKIDVIDPSPLRSIFSPNTP